MKRLLACLTKCLSLLSGVLRCVFLVFKACSLSKCLSLALFIWNLSCSGVPKPQVQGSIF